MDDLAMAGRVALVAGASKGIGAATAEAFAATGAAVVLGARDTEALASVVRRIEGRGGTATAVRTLDAPLDSLVALHTATLQYLPLAGCVVRMMALRANLAAARGARPAAQRWARAVVTLWSGAEPALQPTVTQMRRISEAGSADSIAPKR